MSALDPAQIAAYARQAGFPEHLIPTKVAIALAESSGNPSAHNPNARTGDNSYGLWQINMLGGMGPERRRQFGIQSNEELFDPSANARAAKAIYDSQGLGAWSVYKSGRYKDFLGQAQAAAAQGGSTPSALPGISGSGSRQSSDPLAALSGSLLQGINSAPRPADPLADVALAGMETSFSQAAGLGRGRGPTRMANSPEFITAAAGIGGKPAADGSIMGMAQQAIETLFGPRSTPASAAGGAPLGSGTAAPAGAGGGAMDIVSLGRKLQGAGLRVREHEAFGGVGKHSQGSLHYSGRALDLTDWQDPGESEASWKPRKQFMAERFSQTLGNQAEVYGPHNDPRGHGTHIHLGLPSGSIPAQMADQLVAIRQEALKRYPLRWAG
jgi:hypothetical protein